MIDLDDILKTNTVISNSKNYLKLLYTDIISLLPTSDCFLEIGAFEASFSIDMKKRFPKSQVFAFEAGKYNYEYNSSVFDYSSNGVNYLNLAISDKEEVINFYVRNNSDEGKVFGANGIIERTDESEYQEVIQVQATPIDLFLSQNELLDKSKCMWVDAEGSLKKVFGGAKQSLENTLAIFVEVEEYQYWSDQWLRKDVENFLTSNGFVPIARDFEDNLQYDVIFIKEKFLENKFIESKIIQYFDLLQLNLY